jgi:hypothetical protein
MQMPFWDPFTSIFNIFGIMFVIIPIIFIVVVIIIVATVCRSGARVAGNVARGFTMEAPSFVIPERHRGQTRSDGSQMTTVRLPERCPSCGAAISQEGIDWVGPLEAKCTYCGGTLRATFERI